LNYFKNKSGKAMMTSALLPPRGIFIPTHMIFNPQLPPAVLVTWIQLRCLAWRGWDTPPFSISELATLIGIHPNRLHKHLSHLKDISALSWRTAGHGKLILSFPEEPSAKPEKHAVPSNFPDTRIQNSEIQELPDSPSYFPSRILGYLSFQEDQEAFSYLPSIYFNPPSEPDNPCYNENALHLLDGLSGHGQ
jgi:hypothetical protein